MGTNDISIDNRQQMLVFEDTNSAPHSGSSYLAPPREGAKPLSRSPGNHLWSRLIFAGQGSGFREYLAIIGPVSKELEGYFPLSFGQARNALEAIPNLVKLLKEETPC